MLHTVDALGLKVSFGKGERGSQVTWTGVRLQLVDSGSHGLPHVLLTLPGKFLDNLSSTLESWDQKGMAALRELSSTAGRVSWLAGILPAARWVLAVFYAVLTERTKEVEDGSEAQGRAGRQDGRRKDHLFPVKRLEQARTWLVEYIKVAKERPTRTVALGGHMYHSVTLLTDAGPEGLGGILLVNNKVMEALASGVDHQDARHLQFELGTSASQGICEALAILVCLKHWKAKLGYCELTLTIQSDSITALALTKRLAAGSAGLNFIGAELALLFEECQVQDVQQKHVRARPTKRRTTWPGPPSGRRHPSRRPCKASRSWSQPSGRPPTTGSPRPATSQLCGGSPLAAPLTAEREREEKGVVGWPHPLVDVPSRRACHGNGTHGSSSG